MPFGRSLLVGTEAGHKSLAVGPAGNRVDWTRQPLAGSIL
jgi:hypothetical protein